MIWLYLRGVNISGLYNNRDAGYNISVRGIYYEKISDCFFDNFLYVQPFSLF